MANAFGYCFVEDFQIQDPTVPDDSRFYFPKQCPDYVEVGLGREVVYLDYQRARTGSLSLTLGWQGNPALAPLFKKIKADYVSARDGLSLSRCWIWYFNPLAAGYVATSGVMVDPDQTNFYAGGDLVQGLKLRFNRLELHNNQHIPGVDPAKWAQTGSNTMVVIGYSDFSTNEDWLYG